MKPVHRPTDTGLQVQVNRRLADLERRQGTAGLPHARFSVPSPGLWFDSSNWDLSGSPPEWSANGYRVPDLSATEANDCAHWVSDLVNPAPLTGDSKAVIDTSGVYLAIAHVNMIPGSPCDPANPYTSGICAPFPTEFHAQALLLVDGGDDSIDSRYENRTNQSSTYGLGQRNHDIPLTLSGVKLLEAGQTVQILLWLGSPDGPDECHFLVGGGDVGSDTYEYTYLDLTLIS